MRNLSLYFSIAVSLTSCTAGRIGNGYAPKENETGIFGVFIQRLGFASGGTPQLLIIQNTKTKEKVHITVKPMWTSKKRNSFIATLEPGIYDLIAYHYPEGFKQNLQNIYACTSGTECRYYDDIAANNDTIKIPRYKVTVTPNKISCIGVLDFSQIDSTRYPHSQIKPSFYVDEKIIAETLNEDKNHQYGSASGCKTPF